MAAKTKKTTKTAKSSKAVVAPKVEKTKKNGKATKNSVAAKVAEVKTTPAPKLPAGLKVKRSYVSLAIGIAVVALLLYLFRGLFVVATVNGQPITRLALIKELEAQAGKQALNTLITKSLIEQEGRKKNVSVSKQEVDAEIKKIEDNLAKQGTKLETALQMQGLTREDLVEQIRYQKIIEKIVGSDIKVTDQEVNAYIESNKEAFPTDAKPEDLKKEVQEQLRQEKLNTKIQEWLANLQKSAKINYIVEL